MFKVHLLTVMLCIAGISALAQPVPAEAFDSTAIAPVVALSTELRGSARAPLAASIVQVGDSPSATPIQFEFAHAQWAELRVLDESGQVVKTIASGRWAPRTHHLAWHGDNDQFERVDAGTYVIELRIPGESEIRSAR